MVSRHRAAVGAGARALPDSLSESGRTSASVPSPPPSRKEWHGRLRTRRPSALPPLCLARSSPRYGRKQTPLAYQVELDQPAAADTCSARQSAMDLGSYSRPYVTDATCSALLHSHICSVCSRFNVC